MTDILGIVLQKRMIEILKIAQTRSPIPLAARLKPIKRCCILKIGGFVWCASLALQELLVSKDQQELCCQFPEIKTADISSFNLISCQSKNAVNKV